MAKARFDNLADAPDELTFRKGDIVTVIERDVDGIVGWWLCLLHGKQGIAPGNRLQIISQFDVSRNGGSQGSLSNDDFSDSFDGSPSYNILTQASEYDTLPTPVKASHGQLYDYPSPQNIKDVYASDRKAGNLISYPNYAVPQGSTGPESDYDIVPKKYPGGTNLSPAELYDIPQGANKSAKQTAEELYDVPSRRPTIIQKTSTPTPESVKPDFQSVLSVFTAIPGNRKNPGVFESNNSRNSSKQTEYNSSQIYDTPNSTKSVSSQDVYDTPPSLFSPLNKKPSLKSAQHGGKFAQNAADQSALYDVIPTRNKQPSAAEDMYDILPPSVNFRTGGLEAESIYDQPSKSPYNDSQAGNDIYDVPPSKINLQAGNEIYNVPPTNNNNSIRQRDNNYKNALPVVGRDLAANQQDIYDHPPRKDIYGQSPSDDIYDHPPRGRNPSQEDIYDHPPRGGNSAQEDIYDHPPRGGNSAQEDIYDHPPRGGNPAQEDIYDHPPRGGNPAQEDIYDHPPRGGNSAHEDIYDHPPREDSSVSEDIYDHPPRGNLRTRQDDTYDILPARPTMGNVANDDASQGLYDVPTQHDINKVMKDISHYETSNQSLIKPYGKHHRRERSNNPSHLPRSTLRRFSEDDDDYVDYQDIYGKEPPAEMIKEMEKVSLIFFVCYYWMEAKIF